MVQAAEFDGGLPRRPPEILPVSRAADPQRRLATSFAQERMWFLDQFSPGTAEYNVTMSVVLAADWGHPRSGWSFAALQAALLDLVRRHEPLRTTFGVDEQGRAFQRVAARAPLLPVAVDLRSLQPLGRAVGALGAAPQPSASRRCCSC